MISKSYTYSSKNFNAGESDDPESPGLRLKLPAKFKSFINMKYSVTNLLKSNKPYQLWSS